VITKQQCSGTSNSLVPASYDSGACIEREHKSMYGTLNQIYEYKEYVYIKTASMRGARRTRGDLSLGHEITNTSIYHF
jgi:hypothetical protein